MNNYLLMQSFLDIIKELAISNPDKQITSEIVYSVLIRYNIPANQKPLENIQELYRNFYKRYQKNDNINLYEVPNFNFLVFSNGKMSGNEIKLYLPYDAKHISKAGEMIFDFLAKNNITHQSKIAHVVRNDDLVIRVNNLEDANLIINFVNSNNYLRSNLLNVNPFLPNQNGIGITMDNGYSFNDVLCNIIADLIYLLKRENRLNDLNIVMLNEFINQQKETIYDLDKKDIYTLLSKTTRSDFQIEEFYIHAKNKLLDDYTENRKRITDDNYYLKKALQINEKYYPGYGAQVLKRYSKGDDLGFTRKENARDILNRHVAPEKVELTVLKYLASKKIFYQNEDDLYKVYVNNILGIENKKIDSNLPLSSYLEQAVRITEKYHPGYGVLALKQYVFGNALGFTRSEGARDIVLNNIKPGMVKSIIIEYLNKRGIKYYNESEIYELFVNHILNVNRYMNNTENIGSALIETLKNAYLNTKQVYNDAQAQAALKHLLEEGNLGYFTNRFNDRDTLQKMIRGQNSKLCIQEYLGEDYYTASTDVIIEAFIENLNARHI